ncbi:MAG: M50 family metallopeptidase [Capsulimonadales bacterium]|nr:M50 family metallopeptidase [Capsulimonadales bacterium]
MGSIYFVLVFLLILGILVFFHELGHFLAAKMLGMRVLEFAFNMGPRVVRLYHDGETEYTIRAIPLGGFVRIAGMEVEDEVSETAKLTNGLVNTNTRLERQEAVRIDETPSASVRADDPRGYNNRPVWQRAIVILAGPVFSFLLGWITLCLIGVVAGIPDKTQLGVGEVLKGSVAEQVGLKKGDTITAINAKPVENYTVALKTIHASAGQPLTLRLRDKEGTLRDVSATPRTQTDRETGKQIGLLGFQPEPITLTVRRTSLAESFSQGNMLTLRWFELMGSLISSGAITKSVGGPVAIFKETTSASKRGGPEPMFLLGQLSLSLGLFNLFPIPILDGGHLMLLALESLRRRKLTPAQTAGVQYAGLAILLTIFILVMFKDVSGLLKNG